MRSIDKTGTCGCGRRSFFKYLFRSGPKFYCQLCYYLGSQS